MVKSNIRIVLGIEYDGSAYAGWQRQADQKTVQSMLELALSKVADQEISVVVAGRTDAGVHALAQVVHFDTNVKREAHAWVMGGNTYLPDDIKILWMQIAVGGFHARYGAIARFYQYIIYNKPIASALHRTQVTWYFKPLEAHLMHQAAQYLIGEHDFSSFRAQGCQAKRPQRRIYFIKVYREQDRVIIDVCANSFLYHMVRNIAGVLLAIGAGKQPISWVQYLLASKDRKQAGVTALPHGLYLKGICYPEYYKIPTNPIFTRLPASTKRFSHQPCK